MSWEFPIHTYPPKDALEMALAEIERLRAVLLEIADMRYSNTSAATIARRTLENKP